MQGPSPSVGYKYKCNGLGYRLDAGSRDQTGVGLNSQALREEIKIGTGPSGGGNEVVNAGRQSPLWRGERVDRGNESLRRIRIKAQLRRIADRRTVSDVLIDGDFDGLFAAWLVDGFESEFVGVVLIAATHIVHCRFHHGARKDRLNLQGSQRYQQEQQRPRE